MSILFTKSDTLLSELIRKITKEPVSHCALLVNGWVIHINLLGLQIQLLKTFQEEAIILYSVDIPLGMEAVMRALSRNTGKMGYDYGALLYLGLRYLLPFLPKKKLMADYRTGPLYRMGN